MGSLSTIPGFAANGFAFAGGILLREFDRSREIMTVETLLIGDLITVLGLRQHLFSCSLEQWKLQYKSFGFFINGVTFYAI